MFDDSYSVSELNTFIRDVLNAGIPQPVWVCGEVQGFNRQKTKRHIFFKLIEKAKSSQQTKAEIELVIWEGVKASIQKTLKNSPNAFDLKDDIEVRFLCKVDFYPPHGRVRLTVEAIDPAYTLGKLAQERLKVIEKLTKASLLEKNKQLGIADVPLSIGLITSFDSAAYNDFMAELSHSGFAFKVSVKNSLMQGKFASASIVAAIKQLQEMSGLDVIVITRGGGSMTDLSCFDQENLATAVAHCKLPVITGIGHEIDLTISDMAAHTTKKTPTATARFLVERVEQFLERLDDRKNVIVERSRQIMTEEKSRLKDMTTGLQPLVSGFLKSHHERLLRFTEVVRRNPVMLLKSQQERSVQVYDRLSKAARGVIQRETARINSHDKVIHFASPVNTLKRGFSLARNMKGEVIKSVKNLNDQDNLILEFKDGTVEGKVDGSTLKERNN